MGPVPEKLSEKMVSMDNSQVQSGMVHIGSLKSFRAFERFAESRGYEEWFHSWIEPQWLAWLIALLKECADEPMLFPHGKWAAIQHMEGLLIEAARAELPLSCQRKEFR
jgi:hypothetical protein